MDTLIDFLAQLDVPPALVAGLAAFTVGYVLYEFLVRRRIAASQAEKQLRGFLTDAADEATFILRGCVKDGMVFEKGGYFHNRFQLIPPLTIRDETIDRALGIFDRAFTQAEKEFGSQ